MGTRHSTLGQIRVKWRLKRALKLTLEVGGQGYTVEDEPASKVVAYDPKKERFSSN